MRLAAEDSIVQPQQFEDFGVVLRKLVQELYSLQNIPTNLEFLPNFASLLTENIS